MSEKKGAASKRETLSDLIERLVRHFPSKERLQKELLWHLAGCKDSDEILRCLRRWLVSDAFAQVFLQVASQKLGDGELASLAWLKWQKAAQKFDPIHYNRVTLWGTVDRWVFDRLKCDHRTDPLGNSLKESEEELEAEELGEGCEGFWDGDQKRLDFVGRLLYWLYGHALDWVAEEVSAHFANYVRFCWERGIPKHEEWAKQIGIKPASSKVELSRWRKALRKKLEKMQVTEEEFCHWVAFSLSNEDEMRASQNAQKG